MKVAAIRRNLHKGLNTYLPLSIVLGIGSALALVQFLYACRRHSPTVNGSAMRQDDEARVSTGQSDDTILETRQSEDIIL